MGRGMMAGMTDYRHQTFEDILTDLHQWIENLKDTLDTLQQYIEKLEGTGYLHRVNSDFTNLIHYSMKFFTTSVQEISEIITDMKHEVRPDHVRRLQALYQTARQLNIDYGAIWHREYRDKEYGNKDFALVEKMYGDGRDMAADMLDLSNLSFRLEDFIGRKSHSKPEEDMEHKIDFLELKPNFFGLGVNLNALIKRLFRRGKPDQ